MEEDFLNEKIKLEELMPISDLFKLYNEFEYSFKRTNEIISEAMKLLDLIIHETPIQRQERLGRQARAHVRAEDIRNEMDRNDNNVHYVTPSDWDEVVNLESDLNYEARLNSLKKEFTNCEGRAGSYKGCIEKASAIETECRKYAIYDSMVSKAKDMCSLALDNRIDMLREICPNETALYFTAKRELEMGGDPIYDENKKLIGDSREIMPDVFTAQDIRNATISQINILKEKSPKVMTQMESAEKVLNK